MNKKILIVHSSLGTGGAEKMIAFIANSLAERYEIHLLLLENKSSTLFIEDRVTVHTADCNMGSPLLGSGIKKSIQNVKSTVHTIQEQAIRIKPDVAIAFDDRVTVEVWMALKKSDVKLLFSQRNDPYDKPYRWKVITKYIYHHCDGAIFQTEEVRQFYRLGSSDKCRVIANPAVPRKPDSHVPVALKEMKFIFSGGRFQYRKGFDVLIKAFHIVYQKYPQYKLYIFGEGEEYVHLKAMVSQLGMNDSIYIHIAVKDVISVCKHAEMFVLPSRSEGIPNMLIESMLAGIPCIAADCSPGGARLMLNQGKCGLLVPKDNEKALADAMIRYIEDRELKLNMAQKAKAYLENFRPEIIKKQWLNYISEMMSEGIV